MQINIFQLFTYYSFECFVLGHHGSSIKEDIAINLRSGCRVNPKETPLSKLQLKVLLLIFEALLLKVSQEFQTINALLSWLYRLRQLQRVSISDAVALPDVPTFSISIFGSSGVAHVARRRRRFSRALPRGART